MSTGPKQVISYKLTDCHKAIYQALKRDDTFAAFIMPGEPLSSMRFVADLDGRDTISDVKFAICQWNMPSSERIVIRDTISAADYLKSLTDNPDETADNRPEVMPCNKSTDKLLYKGQVLSIVTDLAENYPSKTVLSRVICGRLTADDDASVWLQVVHDYFKSFKNTFRFVYSTPETGCWIGATPEVLLSADRTTGDAETMALAGTRTVNLSTKAWDEKNINEQGMVVQFIMEMLNKLNIDFDMKAVDDVAFGSIRHKCEHFTLRLGDRNPYDVIDRLNPTPALSGYPRANAIAHIDRYELHDRNCYGGYVAVDDDRQLRAFVNLRCVHFYKKDYCIYAGGGLTEDSKAEEEWTETENKIEKLKLFISCNDAALHVLERYE